MAVSASNRVAFTRLVLLLPALVTALKCDSLQHSQRMLNAQILQLLRQKSPNVPPECLTQMTGFNFPTNELEVREPQLTRRAAYEILRGMLGLFSSNLEQMGWETSAQESLLNDLYSQVDRIKRCFEEDKTEPQHPEESLNKSKLQRYFQVIRTFLQENRHSPCAGIIMRMGVQTCLTNLDLLLHTRHLSNQPVQRSGPVRQQA